jgi:hypothetical protein
MKRILALVGILVAGTFVITSFILKLLPSSFTLAGFYAILALSTFNWNKELTKLFGAAALAFVAIGLFFQAFPGFGA